MASNGASPRAAAWPGIVHDGDWGYASQYNNLLSAVQTWPGDVSAGGNKLVGLASLSPSGASIAVTGDVDFQGHVLRNIGNGSLTAGAGISVNAATITNTSPNVQSDWNAAGGLAQILNRPNLATVATTGNYNDLTNKPVVPAAQVQTDWNASAGMASILNKPPITYSGGVTTITGPTTHTGAVTCQTTLAVSGASTLASLTVTGASALQGGAAVTGGNLSVTGWTLFVNSTDSRYIRMYCGAGADPTINSSTGVINIDVDVHHLTAHGVFWYNSGNTQYGRTIFDSFGHPALYSTTGWVCTSDSINMCVRGQFQATGAASLSSTLTVTGLTTLNGGLTVTGGNIDLNSASSNIRALAGSAFFAYSSDNSQYGYINCNASGNLQTTSTGGYLITQNLQTNNSLIVQNTVTVNNTGGSNNPFTVKLANTTNSFCAIVVHPNASYGQMNIGCQSTIAGAPTGPYLYSSVNQMTIQSVLYVTGSVSATAHNTHASGKDLASIHQSFKRRRREFIQNLVHDPVEVGGWGLVQHEDGLHILIKRSEDRVSEFILPWEQAKDVA